MKRVPLKRYRHIRNVQELHISNSNQQHEREHRLIVGMSCPEAARPPRKSLARRRRAQTSSADIQSITTATVPDRQAAVSNSKSTSVSVDRTMQSDDNSPPEKSKHAELRKFHLQRQNLEINAANVQTSPKSTSSAIKCRVADDAYSEKTKITETTALTTTGEKKVHRHQFRRKKRQKDRRNSQEE